MSYPRHPNIYPQFAHDPECRCCHPNDRPYCDCACHRQAAGEIVALRARWDTTERIPMGEPIGVIMPPSRPAPPPQQPAPTRSDARLASLPGRVAN